MKNSMKYFWLMLLLLLPAVGQCIDFPTIKTNAKNIKEFVPKNWRVMETAWGDLNHDNRKDIVMVLQCTDPENKMMAEDSSRVDANPRILMIAFKDSAANVYNLVLQSNTFILTHDQPAADEPFQGMRISNDMVQFNFHVWAKDSARTCNCSYKFRYQNARFELIGYDAVDMKQVSGEMEKVSINFATKKMSVQKVNIDEKVKPEAEVRSFDCPALKDLRTFIRPFTWTFEGQVL
ncbi:hypothetical protein [Taibaiella soli]|uniref:VCBS repeat-containing protein n=1 Tax=Taibaiella soli TaxID=1649169 RepID=A0A2W2B373_9BACT|nr:hypothetical protein [Taibaiella soli]PZF74508.1 hypothetical protein DN068_02730 [Taibaiella soli]